MRSVSPFTEEGRSRLKNFQQRAMSYVLGCLMIGLLAGVGFAWWRTSRGFLPLQRIYLTQYMRATLMTLLHRRKPSKYVLLVREVNGQSFGVSDADADPVLDGNGQQVWDQQRGPYFHLHEGIERKYLYWKPVWMMNSDASQWFKVNIYSGSSLFGFYFPALIIWLIVTLAGGALLTYMDVRINDAYEEGDLIRGTRLLSVDEAVKQAGRARGVGVKCFNSRRHVWLRVDQAKECEHILILGDPGVGKSVLIHSMLRQIAARETPEAAIIYDPACEFVRAHFNAERGDIILNPRDVRCPYWSPAGEILQPTDASMLAESFYPGPQTPSPTAKFFNKAARDCFAEVISRNPTLEKLILTLKSAVLIDKAVHGTSAAHYVDKNAGNQRGGVLGSLAEAGSTLNLLPMEEECEASINLTEWARERRGWIFITSTKDTRDALRHLHAIFIDLLMKRLMSVDPNWGREHPCWLVIDEVHALHRLPALHDALVEGRKYGIKIVLGTQGKSQFEEHYGHISRTMLSAPHLKVLFRCNEPEGARWIQDLIGEAEVEKHRTGTTATVSKGGRDSINYSSVTDRRPVVSREQIMGLPDLVGYWKCEDRVVPIRMRYEPQPQVAAGYLPRQPSRPQPNEQETPPEQKLTGATEQQQVAQENLFDFNR